MATRSTDAVWQALRKRMVAKPQAHTKVGILQAKGGNETTEDGFTMVGLGAVHEFGSKKANIPERSFIRRTFKTKERELKQVTAKLAKKVIEQKLPMHKALDLLGAWGTAEIKKTITAGKHIPPILAKATVAARKRRSVGSDRPLMDMGRLVGSITWGVFER